MRSLTFSALIAIMAMPNVAIAQDASQPPVPPPSTEIPADAALSLHLICRGTGEHKITNLGTAFAFSGNRSASAFGASTQDSQFGEQMDIDISNGAGKVRVPRRFLPPLHGGDGGWFEVSELSVGPDEITGKVAINFANHPNLRIDRRSGSVALDGKVGAFAGQCEKYDPGQHAF